jgi:hypothetical protein
MEQEELIKQKARKFINSPDIKDELDPATRIWLEQHIVNLLEDFAKKQSAGKKGKKDFLSDVTDAMFRAPFANELKHELAKVILKHYPTAKVKQYLIKEEQEPHTSKDWG